MSTLYRALAAAAGTWPDRPALIDCSGDAGEPTRTYRELLAEVDALAEGLRRLGFSRGDALAVWLPNCLRWPRLLFACAKLGVLVVPLNTRYRPAELYHLLATSRAKALVYAPRFETVDFASRLEQVWVAARERPDRLALRWLLTVGDDHRGTPPAGATAMSLDELGDPGLGAGARELAEPDDPLVVFGTSGTTSAPKLAVHTHASVGAHLPAVADVLGLDPAQRQLCVLPLGGVFGFVPFLAGLLAGVPSVLLPIFDRARVLDALARHRATFMTCAEGPLRELLADPALPAATEGGQLAKVVTGGVAIDDIVAAAGRLGVSAMNVYGSSEVLAYAATWSFGATDDERTVPGGRLVAPGLRVRVMSSEDAGRPAAPDELGEVQFRGPTVFSGYLANEAATDKAFTPDGWYRSGDMGRLLPGGDAFEFRSRLDDKLRLRGYLVNPSDIETALHEHPAVDMAQLVGVRDRHTGDHRPVAFVRLVPGAEATPSELVEHCRERLASFKVPDLIEIVTEFPTTPSANGDKVRKEELRRKAATLVTEKDGNGRPGAAEVRSDIALATTDRVSVHGIDLPADILGKVNVGDFAYLELFRRLPTAAESVVFNALVVALIEHGLTPNALASRLTYLGAPESLQGAVAAGLLGLGDRFVGTMEGAARLCQEHAGDGGWRDDPEELDRLAEKIVAEHADAGRFVPGIGHGLHKPVDPRAERLFEIGREQGLDPANERLMRALSAAAQRRTGKALPVNVTGAIGALASTLGVPWPVVRGLGVMARAIGLVGHLLEERERPLARNVWEDAERRSMAHLSHPERP